MGIVARRDQAVPGWADLAQREPRLEALCARAKRLHAGRFDDRIWCGLKHELSALVGWDAPVTNPLLVDHLAYEVAYRHLLTAYETGTTERAI
jgi:hypothetical protein